MTRTLFFCLTIMACLPLRSAIAADEKPDYDNAQWSVTLVGFFPGEAKKSNDPKRLNCYLVRRDGKWTAALATATNSGRPNWNTAFMLVDPAKATVKDGRLSGTLSITLVPDPWVPKDQKPRTAVVKLDAATTPKAPEAGSNAFAAVSGSWTADIDGPEDELKPALLQSHGAGEIIGSVGTIHPVDLADDSYDLAVYNLIPGKTADQFQRRRALSIGVKGGKVISARLGQMDMRHNAYDYEVLDPPTDFSVTPDTFSGKVTFEADTLEGGHAKFNLSLTGRRVHDFAAGTWSGSYVGDDGKRQEISGYFKGTSGTAPLNQLRSETIARGLSSRTVFSRRKRENIRASSSARRTFRSFAGGRKRQKGSRSSRGCASS